MTIELSQMQNAMEAKLKAAGLGFESLKVFGRMRLNIHVTVVSVATANKWCTLLTRITGKPASVTKHTWDAAIQKGTCLKPTLRHGYLVAVVGA